MMLDVSDPTSPIEIDSYDSAGYPRGLAVAGNYVYVADEQGGFLILGGGGGPTLSVNNAAVNEGDTGTTALTFTVTLNASATPTQTITVNYETADSTATNTDYMPISGTLSFAPGETSQTITVAVTGDTLVEPDETFFVNLSNSLNAAIADGQGVGTILNDDQGTMPGLSITDVAVVEGDTGSTTAVFTITLSTTSLLTVTANYETADSTANSTDYTPVSGILTFAPGETSQMITVTINGDIVVEPDETFSLNLSDPINAVIVDGQGIGTIVNDDTETLAYRVYLPIVVKP
jgi:hypothetical protein